MGLPRSRQEQPRPRRATGTAGLLPQLLTGGARAAPAQPQEMPHIPPVLRSRRSLVPRPALRGHCAPGRARGRIPAPPCQAGLPSALVPGCEPRAGPRAPLWDTELTYMMSPLGTPSAPTPSPWQLWDPRAPNISKCFSWGWAGPSENFTDVQTA